MRSRFMGNNSRSSYGVGIQDTNGNIYSTYDEYISSGAKYNGIAVIGEQCKFVIAPTNVSMSGVYWGPSEVIIDGVMNTTNQSEAILDFDGYSNTQKIQGQLGNVYDNAAYYKCVTYQFPNKTYGYLGSLGEWNEAFNHKEEIDQLLSQCGMDQIYVNNYPWTSTQYGSNYAWMIRWREDDDPIGNGPTYSSRSTYTIVRAFGILD